MSQSSSPLFTPPASPNTGKDNEDTVEVDAPPIPGLYYFVDFLDSDEAGHLIDEIIQQGYFDVQKGRDQAVIFGTRGTDRDSGLPKWTQGLLSLVHARLTERHILPAEVLQLLFPLHNEHNKSHEGTSYTRQLILNCYSPGQGIALHIDLPHKFLDGIMIFSFGSSIAMTFEREQEKYSVYLQPCSLCVLSGDSRWEWSHGISEREGDYVRHTEKAETRYIKRGQRLSITVRWYRLEDDETSLDRRSKNHGNGRNDEGVSGTGKLDGNSSETRLMDCCNG